MLACATIRQQNAIRAIAVSEILPFPFCGADEMFPAMRKPASNNQAMAQLFVLFGKFFATRSREICSNRFYHHKVILGRSIGNLIANENVSGWPNSTLEGLPVTAKGDCKF